MWGVALANNRSHNESANAKEISIIGATTIGGTLIYAGATAIVAVPVVTASIVAAPVIMIVAGSSLVLAPFVYGIYRIHRWRMKRKRRRRERKNR